MREGFPTQPQDVIELTVYATLSSNTVNVWIWSYSVTQEGQDGVDPHAVGRLGLTLWRILCLVYEGDVIWLHKLAPYLGHLQPTQHLACGLALLGVHTEL